MRYALCFVLSFPQGCDKKFFSSTELVIHIRNHTGERPFVCSYCGDAFISKSTLSTHEKSIHGIQGKMHGEKGRKRGTSPAVRQTLPLNVPLIFVNEAFSPVCSIQKTKCEICDKVVLKRSLHCHMRKHENPARKLSCTVCGKEFATKGGVTRHEAIHFEDKKYACQYCGKAFVQKANMEVGKIDTGKRESYFPCRVYPFLLVSREDPHRREALLVQVLPGEVRPEHQEVPASSILQVRESVCLVESFVLYFMHVLPAPADTALPPVWSQRTRRSPAGSGVGNRVLRCSLQQYHRSRPRRRRRTRREKRRRARMFLCNLLRLNRSNSRSLLRQSPLKQQPLRPPPPR